MPTLDFPNSPTIGQEHDHDGSTWMWDGTKWMAVMPEDPSVVISETTPTDVPSGTIWFDSLTAQTLVLFGNSWVEIGATSSTSGGGGGGGGGGGSETPAQAPLVDSDDILIEPTNQLFLVNDSVTINNSAVKLGQSVTINSAQVPEGNTNQYFTVERAVDATANALALGTHTNLSVTYIDEPSGSISLTVDPTPNDGTVTTPKLNLEYADQASLPTPVLGQVAYSVADGSLYFAHASAWIKLANNDATALAITTAEANASTYTNTSVANAITQLQIYTDNAVSAEANARILADQIAIDSDQSIIAASVFA